MILILVILGIVVRVILAILGIVVRVRVILGIVVRVRVILGILVHREDRHVQLFCGFSFF